MLLADGRKARSPPSLREWYCNAPSQMEMNSASCPTDGCLWPRPAFPFQPLPDQHRDVADLGGLVGSPQQRSHTGGAGDEA